eukprot:3248521-Amphidinium_carterae.1
MSLQLALCVSLVAGGSRQCYRASRSSSVAFGVSPKLPKKFAIARCSCPEPLLADVFEQKRSTTALPLLSSVEHSKMYREICCLRQYFRDAA